MKIELLTDLPVDGKHGMRAGRVLEVARTPDSTYRGSVRWYVIGDAGEEVGVLRHEASVLHENHSVEHA